MDATVPKQTNVFSKISKEDLAAINKVKEILLPLKEKYNLSFKDLQKLLEEQLTFPLEILSKHLTFLESVVKYLKENKELSLRKISRKIGRDERNVWHIFNKANKKYPERFTISEVSYWVPVSILDSNLSSLEALVFYLKNKFSLSFHEIAVLLKRNDRTVWTVYQRAKNKNEKQK
ncbi:hypothetical protein HY498_00155 [Candidatus Woesearchaeota archaeon]|nr:hypothetical protein [Candidatus Woesearchaeota archaeon]